MIFIGHGIGFLIDWVISKNAIIFLLLIDEKLKVTEIKQYMEFLTQSKTELQRIEKQRIEKVGTHV